MKEDTVEAVLDLVWKLRDDEHEKSSSFRARGVGIAGFAGLIGALASSVSKDLLGAPLESPWRTISVAVFVVSMIALAATVAIVIIGVLRPREGLSLGAAEIREYPTWEVVASDKAMVQGRAMYGLTDVLLRQRDRNDGQAHALTWAYRLLLVGILAIVLLGITLGLRYADVIPERKGPAAIPRVPVSAVAGGQTDPPVPPPEPADATEPSRGEQAPTETSPFTRPILDEELAIDLGTRRRRSGDE